MRWTIKGLPLEHFNDNGGSVGEPFAVIQDKTGGTIVLTKDPQFVENDEERSSVHHPQMERERG